MVAAGEKSGAADLLSGGSMFARPLISIAHSFASASAAEPTKGSDQLETKRHGLSCSENRVELAQTDKKSSTTALLLNEMITLAQAY